MILGNSKIGNNVILGAGTCIKDDDIPDDSIVFGSSPNLIIKKRR
jgi:serine O-acetyltransferase